MIFAASHNNFRPRILTWRYAVYFALILGALAGLAIAYHNADIVPIDNSAALAVQNIITLTNEARLQNGVQGVGRNILLENAAQAKADDMAAKGYFAHFTDDGMTPWKFMDNAGYNYVYAGENLAVHFSREQDVIAAWLNSPTHRANLLNPVFKDIGIGISEGMYQGNKGFFVVQMFGTTVEELGRAPINISLHDLGANAASARQALSDPMTLATIIAAAMVLLVALAVASTLFTGTATLSGLIVALTIALIAIASTVAQNYLAGSVII
jgi:hypothetical protein